LIWPWPAFLTFASRYISRYFKGPGISAAVTANPAKPRTELRSAGRHG